MFQTEKVSIRAFQRAFGRSVGTRAQSGGLGPQSLLALHLRWGMFVERLSRKAGAPRRSRPTRAGGIPRRRRPSQPRRSESCVDGREAADEA